MQETLAFAAAFAIQFVRPAALTAIGSILWTYYKQLIPVFNHGGPDQPLPSALTLAQSWLGPGTRTARLSVFIAALYYGVREMDITSAGFDSQFSSDMEKREQRRQSIWPDLLQDYFIKKLKSDIIKQKERYFFALKAAFYYCFTFTFFRNIIYFYFT